MIKTTTYLHYIHQFTLSAYSVGENCLSDKSEYADKMNKSTFVSEALENTVNWNSSGHLSVV